MEQETRKFAIEQAIKLVSVRQDITDKTKAVFDLAESIISWVNKSDEDKTENAAHVSWRPNMDWKQTPLTNGMYDYNINATTPQTK